MPESVQRRSLITYYYTSTTADIVFDEPHRALFIHNDYTLKDSAYDDVEVIL